MPHREVTAAASGLTPAEVLAQAEPAPPPDAREGAGAGRGGQRAGLEGAGGAGRGLRRRSVLHRVVFTRALVPDAQLRADYLRWRFERVRRAPEAGGREDCRRGAGSQPGRRDVSAVLCGPGELGWVPRGVDGSRGGAGSLGTARASLVCTRAPGWNVVRMVDRPGQTPRRLGDCLGPERGAGQAGKPSVARAGAGTRGSPRVYPEVSPSGLQDFAGARRAGLGGRSLLLPRVSSPPGTQMSSVAHPGKDAGLGTISFPKLCTKLGS